MPHQSQEPRPTHAQGASDRLEGDFATDTKDYDAVHDEVLEMADVLSAGTIAQFPDMFA